MIQLDLPMRSNQFCKLLLNKLNNCKFKMTLNEFSSFYFFWVCLLVINFNLQAFADSSYQGLGKDSVSAQQIEKFQPKSLPPELTRRIQSFFDIRAPGMGMIHPDGKQLFFTWKITGVTHVFKLDNPKGFPVQLTGGEDATGLVDLTADGKFLVITRDRNGEENPGLYLQSTRGGELKKIQHLPKIQTLFAFSSEDSRYIYYRSNDVKADSYYIYRYDIKTEKKELVFSDLGYWVVEDHWKDSKLLLAKAITNTASEHYELDLNTKKITPLLGVGEKEDYSISYGLHGNQFVVKTNKFSEEHRLYFYENQKFQLIAPTEKEIKSKIKNKKPSNEYEFVNEIESFSVDPKNKYLAYSWNKMGYTHLDLLDLKTLKKIPIQIDQSKADHVYNGTWSKTGQQIMLGIDNGVSPRISYSLNLKSGLLTQWVLPSVPEIDTADFVRAKSVMIPSEFGEMPAFVRIPKVCETKLCPVIVHFHGGPEAQSQPGFSAIFQLFASSGFIVLEPNVRGSSGYGKKYLDADNGANRLKVIEDLRTVSVFAKKTWAKNGVEPKVGVMGWSYGGYATMYAMTKFAGSYDAGVALVGISHLISFINNTAAYRRALRIPEYGDPEKDKEAMLELSPISHIQSIKDPLLIIQGVSDPRVPVGEAVQMYQQMQNKNISGELILFADEGHGSQKRSNQVLEIGHTLLFFQKHLTTEKDQKN